MPKAPAKKPVPAPAPEPVFPWWGHFPHIDRDVSE